MRTPGRPTLRDRVQVRMMRHLLDFAQEPVESETDALALRIVRHVDLSDLITDTGCGTAQRVQEEAYRRAMNLIPVAQRGEL